MKKERFLQTAAVVLMVCLAVPNIILAFNENVWMDEIITLRYCQDGSFQDILAWARGDVHPPLYYFMLRVVSALTGQSLVAMKLLSVFAHIGMLLCGFLFIRKEFGYRAMLFFGLFITVMPQMFTYSVEIRMYEWAMLFVVLCGQAAYLVMKRRKKRDWVFLGASALLCAYTHYYALVCAAMIFAGLFLWMCMPGNRKAIRQYAVTALFTIVGYCPWLPVFLQQTGSVKEEFWITESSIYYYLSQMLDCGIPYSLYINLLLFVGLIVIIIKKQKDLGKEAYCWSVGCIAAFPVIFLAVYLFSTLFSPIIVVRYLLIVLVLLALGISVACKYVPGPVFGVLVFFYLLCGIVQYRAVWKEQFVDSQKSVAILEEYQNEIIFSEIANLSFYLNFYDSGIQITEWNRQEIPEEALLISAKTPETLQEEYGILAEKLENIEFKTIEGVLYRIQRRN